MPCCKRPSGPVEKATSALTPCHTALCLCVGPGTNTQANRTLRLNTPSNVTKAQLCNLWLCVTRCLTYTSNLPAAGMDRYGKQKKEKRHEVKMCFPSASSDPLFDGHNRRCPVCSHSKLLPFYFPVSALSSHFSVDAGRYNLRMYNMLSTYESLYVSLMMPIF